LLDTNLLRIWLCPDPMAHGNSQALIHLLGTSVNRGLEGLGAPPKLPLSQPAPASCQGVSVGVVLVAQRPAVAKHHLHLGHLSPPLLRLLALPRSQREELPRLFCAPNQNEGLGPRCVIQRPLDEGSPRLDELLLASCPNQPFTRAVGMACHLHFRCLLRPLTQLVTAPTYSWLKGM
jgi:hypothetical protein